MVVLRLRTGGMQRTDTPFQSGWWGQELAGVRPGLQTYNRYSLHELPPLPFTLNGQFEWLRAQPPRLGHIGLAKPDENNAAIVALIADAAGRAVELPAEFLSFARSR